MKTLAHIIPVRPQICAACDARTWTLLQPGDGIAPWLSSAVVWSVALGTVWLAVQAPQPRDTAALSATAQPVATEAAEPTSLPTLLPTLEPTAEPTAVSTAEPTAEATPPPTMAPTPAPKPSSEPKAKSAKPVAGKIRLRSMDVAVKGDVIEVVIDSDADDLKYTLSKSGRANGYVLDLAGKWTLPRSLKMTRDFSTTNVAQLRMGLHDDYFRVVFSLRDGKVGPPVIERDGGRLRIRSQ